MKEFKNVRVPDDRCIDDLWQTIWGTAAVAALMKSGIAEALDESSLGSEEVASKLNLHFPSTDALLRVLVAMGFVRERSKRFVLTKESKAYLVPSSLLYRGDQLWEIFETPQFKFIEKHLRIKRPPKQTFGDDWKSGEGDNKAAESIAEGMDAVIKASAITSARSGAFDSIKKLLDVGGGSGVFASAITGEVPGLEAVILDLPAMCYQADKFIKKRGASRVSTHGADFFSKNWPRDCDGILLSNVLHDWPINDVKKILKNARRYIDTSRGRGSIFINEALLNNNRNGPFMVTIFNLQMQMGFGGQQFTKGDLKNLLEECGFSRPRIVSSFGYYSLLKAKAV